MEAKAFKAVLRQILEGSGWELLPSSSLLPLTFHSHAHTEYRHTPTLPECERLKKLSSPIFSFCRLEMGNTARLWQDQD